MEVYKSIVVRAKDLIEDDLFNGQKQDSSDESFFGPVRESDREIFPDRTSNEIHNLIGALSMTYKDVFFNRFTFWNSYLPDPGREEELKTEFTSPGVL
jgi:hypothetical protein